MSSAGSLGLGGWTNMPKKVNSATLKNIINSNIKLDEEKQIKQAVDSKYKEQQHKSSGLDRLASKKSELSEKDETVKFELVEDINLITIPITTCLTVLISYIIIGAVIFSAWEVRSQVSGKQILIYSYRTGPSLMDSTFVSSV